MSFEADPGQLAPGAAGNQGSPAGQGTFGKAADMFTSGSLSGAAVQNAASETQKLIDAAKSGGFKVDPNAITDLRKSLADMQNNLTHLMQNSNMLEQAPKLGDYPYGHTVAAHDQKSAAGSEGAVTVILQQLQQVLTAADEALQRAAGIYHESDQQAHTAIKTVQV